MVAGGQVGWVGGEWGGGGVGISRKGKDADSVDSTVCCGLRGKKGERRVRRCGCGCCCSGSLQRSRNVLKRFRSLHQEGNNRQKKKDKNSSCRRRKRSEMDALSHRCCLEERQRKKLQNGDTRWSLSVAGGSLKIPPTGNHGQIEMFTLELEIYFIFILVFF